MPAAIPRPAILAAVDLLGEVGLPALIVVTKIDKTGKRAREKRIARLREQLAVCRGTKCWCPRRAPAKGREELLGAITDLLEDGDEGPEGRGSTE